MGKTYRSWQSSKGGKGGPKHRDNRRDRMADHKKDRYRFDPRDYR